MRKVILLCTIVFMTAIVHAMIPWTVIENISYNAPKPKVKIVQKVEVINFDEGVEIVVVIKKSISKDRIVKKHTTNTYAKDTITIKKFGEGNIWITKNVKTGEYAMKFIPLKKFHQMQQTVQNSIQPITDTIDEVIKITSSIDVPSPTLASHP